jgi:hypothetical protein
MAKLFYLLQLQFAILLLLTTVEMVGGEQGLLGLREDKDEQEDDLSLFSFEELESSPQQSTTTNLRGTRRELKTNNGGIGYQNSGACTKLRLIMYKSELEAGTTILPNGFAFQVPVYERETNKKLPIGQWYEQVTHTSDTDKTGIGTSSFVENHNAAISMSRVLGQRLSPITGGSGKFGYCLGGYSDIVGDSASAIFIDLYYCRKC